MQSQTEGKQAFFVQGTDGRKFKMVIRGDLGKLNVGKIRRYLSSYGVPETHLLLSNGALVPDDAEGEDFGLHNDAVLQLISPRSFAQRGSWASGEAALVNSGGSKPYPFAYADPEETHQTNHLNTRASLGRAAPISNSADKINSAKRYDGLINNIGSSNAAVEVENRALRDEVQQLRQELAEAQESHRNSKTLSGNGDGVRHDDVVVDLLHNARENLKELAEELGVPLQFDTNFTATIGADEHNTVLVTFDNITERLYIYATVLTSLPDDPALRVKLYEVLLEGSILGREVCGGGLGMSLQSGIIMLSTTIPLRHCNASALKGVMPSFIETIARWRSLINELLS